jgi:D-glycero-alpha-D-manno-heptose-7-phosphate kinase
MIISRTPFRISFFGGGTDYPQWYRENGGSVLSTTIDKYCYISCRELPRFFDYKHRIVYSQTEMVERAEQIRHPVIKVVLQHMAVEEGLEIHHDADLPARAGMGSSSAFTVGFVNAVKSLRRQQASKEELASMAIHIEQNLLKETIGSQDQISTAYGGFNRIDFKSDDTFSVAPVDISPRRLEELEKSLLLFFTGSFRVASDVARFQVESIDSRRQELSAMAQMVDEGLYILKSQSTPLAEFGQLLHESWMFKRTLSPRVSTPRIDEIYDVAMNAGAIGGKVLGAGGGGFILFYVQPEHQKQVREKLNPLVSVDFKFDGTGSQIILSDSKA